MEPYQREELLACVIARLIGDARHVAVGAASPIPATGAFLLKQQKPSMRISLLQKRSGNPFTEGSRELFDLAGQGRTVLVSSHVLSEVEQTVDDVVIISCGRLVKACSLGELEAMARPGVRITSPDPAGLTALINENGWGPVARFDTPNSAVVHDVDCPQVGEVAYARGLKLHQLSPAGTSLEALFLQLTADPDPGQSVPAGTGMPK